MKRRKASTKMTTVVHSGWMTKSPPERKLKGAFKIFRSQWKKRFFVLRKPSGSLPDQYELHYYKDQRCISKKGSIDLDQCEQIIEALDSEAFANLLAIKTYYKNKVRTYYLAADSEQEMNQWVQWLCHVCGLKPEDQPTDIPDPKPSTTQAAGTSQTSGLGTSPSISNGTPASPPRSNQTSSSVRGASALPVSQQTAISAQPVARTGSDNSLSYIPLEHCTTGQPQPVDRRESVESVPDFLAPAPPQKRQGNQSNGVPVASDDEVFVPGVYDHPPRPIEAPSRDSNSDLYKVPPVRPARAAQLLPDDDRDSSYDVPPPRHSPRHSPRSSLGARTDLNAPVVAGRGGGEARAVTPTECYDYPPPRQDSVSSDNETPPERPPKPGHLQSPYQNLPPAGKLSDADLMNTVPAPPKPHSIRQMGYDVPRSSSHRPARTSQTSSLSVVTPAPRPVQQTSTIHNYLNTQDRHLDATGGSEDGSDVAEAVGGPPAIPPPRSGSAGEPQDGRSASPSVYQTPPSSSASSLSSGPPARPPARSVGQPPSISPRNIDGSAAAGQGPEENAAVIFSTQRTRSFKRHHQVNSNSPKQSRKANTLPMSAPVPHPRPVPPPSRSTEMSTSEEEDEAVRRLSLNDREEETHHPLSLLHSVPPPSSDNDRELKYIDLALPDVGQEPSRSSHGHSHTHSHLHSHADRGKESATEYREIDFVKTQALNDAKRVKEKERKNDDHN